MERQGTPLGLSGPLTPSARELEILVLEEGLHPVTFGEGSSTTEDLASDLLEPPAALPAGAAPVRQEDELARRDATIGSLREMLAALHPLVDEVERSEESRRMAEERLGRREQELAALRARLAQSEEALAGLRAALAGAQARPVADVEVLERLRERQRRLQLKLLERNGVLARERARHARTRERLARRDRLARERWNEIRRLRGGS